ncbi:hypothetical protein M5K25_007843 [Dendrobium thyrsiflorum]|uniref:Uncharacterized protein n=1 Tax=Dendrobium thyrsiflorum TaxID=117978 RepID=A0ABD0VLX0_DENTH
MAFKIGAKICPPVGNNVPSPAAFYPQDKKRQMQRSAPQDEKRQILGVYNLKTDSWIDFFWSGMARKFVEKGSGLERTADIESLDRGRFDGRFPDLEMSDFCVLGLVGLVSSSRSIRL